VYHATSLRTVTFLRDVMMRSISSTNFNWAEEDHGYTIWYRITISNISILLQGRSVCCSALHYYSPALSQFTDWKQSAIRSFCSVPFSHSVFSQPGQLKSVLFFFSATNLLMRAFAALRSFSWARSCWC
jgi:hypothetical protein